MSPASDHHKTEDARLQDVERYTREHGHSIGEVVLSVNGVVGRVEKLEIQGQARAIAEAREDEREKAQNDRLDRVDVDIKGLREEIKDIRGIGTKVLWVFISAILLAAANFILKGGFK